MNRSHRAKLVLGCVYAAGTLGCGPRDDAEQVGVARQADVGDPVLTVPLPSEINCPADDGSGFSHVAISVGGVPAPLIGHPELGNRPLLATNCRNQSGNTIYFVDPLSDPVQVVDTITTSVAPRFGWGALAFRGDLATPDLLACANPESSATAHDIYSINLADGTATKLFSALDENGLPATTDGKPFCDGLAWDPWNDTIYMSPDISDTVYHYTGTGSGTQIGRLIRTLPVPTECFDPSIPTGNSGIEAVGPDLLLACDGNANVYQIRQADSVLVRTYSSGAERAEDLECDRFTFGPDVSVAWTKDAFTSRFLSFEVPPGTCGICRNGTLGDRADLTTLPAADQQELANLLSEYLTGEIVAEHDLNGGFWHNGPGFIPAHRGYIGGFEIWMINVKGISKYVPLPKWNPALPIPAAFQPVDHEACTAAGAIPGTNPGNLCGDNANPNPAIPLPADLVYAGPTPQDGGLCAYTSIEDLRNGSSGRVRLESGYHNPVHGAVGGPSGAMSYFFSPAALVFFPWHAFVDDIAMKWECACQNLCQACVDTWSAVPLTAALAGDAAKRPRTADTAPIGFWWWFEDFIMPPELSPAVVVDHAGFHLQGTVQGGAELVPGHVGQALRLDGGDDFVEVSDRTAGQVGSSDFSVDAWVKTAAAGVEPIVDKRSGNGSGYSLFARDGFVALHLGTANSSATFVAATGRIDDGAWHHVAAVVNRSIPGQSGLFVDGAAVLRFDATTFVGDIASNARFWIGRSQFSRDLGVPHADFFQGEIDELALVRFALSDDLVASIFIAGTAGKLGSLGNLPTWAEQPVCLIQLGDAIDELPEEDRAVFAMLYAEIVDAIHRGMPGVARNKLRELRDLAMQLAEPTFTMGAHFHRIAAVAAACHEQRELVLN
jgi:hypothetical protein